MTWTASLLPDSALPDDWESPPSATPEPLPLWRVMEQAGMNEPGTPRDAIAAEIEALRGWLPDMPPQEFIEQWCDEAACYDLVMVRRTMDWVRALLTEQAHLARNQQ